MSKPKSSSSTTIHRSEGPESGAMPPATGKGSRPRAPKIIGPQWFTARMSDGKYRIIEHVSPEAVASTIVTVTPTTPEDFVQAGRDDVTLEPYSVQSTTE